jgi:uncharacterized damage-inducible protein DinB
MASATEITAAFVEEARETLRRMRGKIEHCVGQVSDEDLNWRAFPGANSIGTIVTHLCGNVSQWIVAGVGEAPVQRDRPGEFAQDLKVSRASLLALLDHVIPAADAAIASVTAETALAPRRIQGYDQTPLSAVFHAVTHFEGHTHQIIYITRLRLGDRYIFKWTPSTPEQVSAKP